MTTYRTFSKDKLNRFLHKKYKKNKKKVKYSNRYFDGSDKVLKGFIRPFCILCNGGSKKDVYKCKDWKCPLIKYRFDNFDE